MTESAATARLPQPFAELAPFAAQWAAADPAARASARDASSAEDRRAFHAAMSGRIAEALDYLDGRPLAGLDSGEAVLLNMALAFVHVVLAEEMQTDAEPVHCAMRQYMKFTAWPREAWNG